MKKIGVLVSGRGSNLQAIIDAVESGYIKAEISVVVSDNPDAYAIKRAEKHGIPFEVVDYKEYASREEAERRIASILEEKGVDLIVLAGFMRVLTPWFIRRFRWKIINIHPALLPSFPGTHGQRQALDYGVRISGCTVHFVDEGVDTGPIIIQVAVPVLQDDDEESLSDRILAFEHKALPFAVKLFVEDRLEVKGRKVIIKDARFSPSLSIMSPLIEDADV